MTETISRLCKVCLGFLDDLSGQYDGCCGEGPADVVHVTVWDGKTIVRQNDRKVN